MGLFSTLAEGPETSSSATVPTVIQLYSAGTKPIQLDTTARVSGYTALTYQAIQVGSSAEVEPKNRHQNPDLGVWNCSVRNSSPTATAPATAGGDDDDQVSASAPTPLVDHLLTKVTKGVRTFCLTVDVSEEENVEPTVSLLQEALVRHLIENPPGRDVASSKPEGGEEADPAAEGDDDRTVEDTFLATATTSLYNLKTTTFGLAVEDKSPKEDRTASENEEADRELKTSLMICALVPASNPEEASEVAYRKKQARALVIYHLRKYAAALNAALCFVTKDEPSSANKPTPSSPAASSAPTTGAPSTDTKQVSDAPGEEQPTVSTETLAQLWRDFALGQEVWMGSNGETTLVEDLVTSPEEDEGVDKTTLRGETAIATPTLSVTVQPTPIYGPGRQQEELIESVLLRNAHCPGHWDASKDSLWVALQAAPEPAPDAPLNKTGDGGWLGQLRNSIASAEPPKSQTPDKPKEEKPKEKDEAVSSFFESLLKNP
jgi:hypothetical protein